MKGFRSFECVEERSTFYEMIVCAGCRFFEMEHSGSAVELLTHDWEVVS
jgi:hypothetical protein